MKNTLQQYPKMDMISKLPLDIITENILCLLPIQEAARTSILAREWRYHWTKIPKLEFIEDTFNVSTDGVELSVSEQTCDNPSKRKEVVKRRKLLNAIYQVLLAHEGPINEFILRMVVDSTCVEEMDHILLRLSKRNTVKRLKLALCAPSMDGYTLPMSFFSLHQLTDVYLSDCAFSSERSFNEFGRITTLYLHWVWADETTLFRLLSSCPSLKTLTLDCDSASLYNDDECTIVDLFECFPAIENLSILFYIVWCFVPDSPKELPTKLNHLKYLCMDFMCCFHIYALPFLAFLIRSSPNLEKLKLVMYDDEWLEEDYKGFFTSEYYSDILLPHLNELEIINFRNLENELDCVKLILAKSPVLKQVRIFLYDVFDEDEELRISKLLLNSPCASPVVKKLIVRPLKKSE